jgi:hypothetical protein
MKTSIKCVQVVFKNKCPHCGDTIDGTDYELQSVSLTDILESGTPCCGCGTDFEWTEDAEILA